MLPVTSFKYPEVVSRKTCPMIFPGTTARLTSFFPRPISWPYHTTERKSVLNSPNISESEELLITFD